MCEVLHFFKMCDDLHFFNLCNAFLYFMLMVGTGNNCWCTLGANYQQPLYLQWITSYKQSIGDLHGLDTATSGNCSMKLKSMT